MRIEGKALEPHPDLTGTIVSMTMPVVYMPMSIIGTLLRVSVEVRRIEPIRRNEVLDTRGIARRESMLLLLQIGLLIATTLSASHHAARRVGLICRIGLCLASVL